MKYIIKKENSTSVLPLLFHRGKKKKQRSAKQLSELPSEFFFIVLYEELLFVRLIKLVFSLIKVQSTRWSRTEGCSSVTAPKRGGGLGVLALENFFTPLGVRNNLRLCGGAKPLNPKGFAYLLPPLCSLYLPPKEGKRWDKQETSSAKSLQGKKSTGREASCLLTSPYKFVNLQIYKGRVTLLTVARYAVISRDLSLGCFIKNPLMFWNKNNQNRF